MAKARHDDVEAKQELDMAIPKWYKCVCKDSRGKETTGRSSQNT